MLGTWSFVALGGLFALFMGRSAVIVLWPESDAAKFCENNLGFMDTIGDSDGGDGDCGVGDRGDGGGDGGGD